MVGAGALCFGGAIISRKRIAIASAGIMLVAMLDLAITGVVPALAWAAALMVAGLLLGLELRLEAGLRAHKPGAVLENLRQHRAAMTASALAYPVMAWLTLGHVQAAHPSSAGMHASHEAASLVNLLPLLFAWVLTAVLLVLCFGSVRRRLAHAAIETGAMAVMILAMLTMSH